MTISKKLSALTVTLTMILSLIGLSTTAHANTTTEITSGNLTWGYKHSWRSHMEAPIISGPGITTGTGGVTVDPVPARIAPNYGYSWSTISQGTLDTNGMIVEFPGILKFQKYQIPPNTDFLVDTTIQNLTLVINPDGTRGALQADVTYRQSEGVGSTTVGPFITKEITLAEVNLSATPVDFTAETITVTNAPTTLTREGGEIVGAPHYGGQAGDPLTFTINLRHTTTPVQPTLNPELKTNKNTYQVGEEITLTFENGQPNTEVEFYLDETKLGMARTNAEGKATLTVTIDKNTTEGNKTTKVTLKDSTDSLAEKTLKVTKPIVPAKPTTPTVKPTPKPVAPAKPAEEKKTEEPRCVTDPKIRGINNGTLSWPFKRSFYSYILSNIGNHGAGKITPGAGAYTNNAMFYYPASHPGSMVNIETKTGRINFAGYFNFYKHNGVLNLTLSSPSLVITSPTTGYLEVSVSSTDMSGKPVIPGRVRFADVTFANTNFSQNSFSANTSSVTLTAQGAKAFAGFYNAGTPLDNFSVNVTLGDKVTCYDANGNPILASTGTDSATLTVFVILALMGTASIALSRKIIK